MLGSCVSDDRYNVPLIFTGCLLPSGGDAYSSDVHAPEATLRVVAPPSGPTEARSTLGLRASIF